MTDPDSPRRIAPTPLLEGFRQLVRGARAQQVQADLQRVVIRYVLDCILDDVFAAVMPLDGMSPADAAVLKSAGFASGGLVSAGRPYIIGCARSSLKREGAAA